MAEANNIPKVYDPTQVEEKWYRCWSERGYFQPSADPNKPVYCITIPPPNVTGSLHIGHALCYTIHDTLIRWRRMQGYNTLCVPGTDHAGIATQNVVEKQLRREGLTRHDLGREKFLERVWDWVREYGGVILTQFQRLGCSFDWSRTRFTMDEGYSRAIFECFVRWWEDGHIYRGKRVINWCPRCLTALSDIEVEHEDQPSKLYYIRYPFQDGSGYVVVATTRPETMLGDTAVAANPADERYQHLFGKTIILPLVGREIPFLADDYAKPEFGTGAVKVTPAHDANDFECGLRHGLPQVVVIDEHARMTPDAGERYAGLDRYEARERVLQDLEAQGLLEKVEDYVVPVATCARCDTVIEPLLSEQWFVRMKEIAQPAIDAVKEGRIRFIPERYTRTYLDWMENIKDWCISRQLWWGHRIPVWTTEDGEYIVARSEEEARQKARGRAITQDEDVLDTWFSSALWPHAVLGWPEQTDDLKTYYPTSVLITARDIIYLWVARMIMTGLYFTGDIPFRDVYIYATVLDEQGRRMSKSLGTGVDPLDLIEMYGADALRFALLVRTAKGQDIRFAPIRNGRHSQVEEARNFCNKVWNASRFVLMNLDDEFRQRFDGSLPPDEQRNDIDRWILSRLNHTIRTVNAALESYDMDDAAKAVYSFLWDEYCDWYIEMCKPRLNAGGVEREVAQRVLSVVLEHTLRLLHPFMPYITEEIWQSLPHEGESIMVAPFPTEHPEWHAPQAEERMERLIEAVRTVRALRTEIGFDISLKANVFVVPTSAEASSLLREYEGVIRTLQRVEPMMLVDALPEGVKAVAAHCDLADVYLQLEAVDLEKERQRVHKELAALQKELERVQSRLGNEQFLQRAPREVVEKEQAVQAELLERQQKLLERLKRLE
ncbi:MAG: valine--tRNA ligase [bacterium]|nr:valine--tRNA ligase [bacterium]